jgi:hypothetical protein
MMDDRILLEKGAEVEPKERAQGGGELDLNWNFRSNRGLPAVVD